MTLVEIEKKLVDQEGLLATMKADNDILKTENALVLKMSKRERSLFAAMPEDVRKTFVGADATKQKAMMDEKDKEEKCKAAEDCMDEATKKRFQKAGPRERDLMVAEVEKAEMEKKGKVPPQFLNNDKEKADKKCPTCKGTGKVDGDTCPDCDGDGIAEPDGDDMEKNKTEIAAAKAETQVLKRELVAADDRITKTERELAEIRKRERLNHFTKRAEEEFPNTAGKPVEKGEMLMSLADSLPGGENGTAYQNVFKSLKAADTALKVNFVEIGKHGGTIPALKAFDAKVEEISKRDKIDQAHAVEKAMMENPDLYLQYEHDQRQFALQR